MDSGEICADTLGRLRGLTLHLQLCGGADGAQARPADWPIGWIEEADLLAPERAPLAPLLTRFGVVGAAFNRRAAAAALLLRFGWAGGFAIASYLACQRAPSLADYALLFSPRSLLHTLWIRDARFCGFAHDRLAGGRDWAGSVGVEPARDGESSGVDERASLRRQLLASLRAFSEPVVEAQHHWSRFSRHALWSMVVSSWAAQFTTLGRQLGDAAWGMAEARATFAEDPEIARSAPQLYEVCVGDAACTCQRRAACCLYFKRPGRPLCASCPLLSEAERLGRNRQWVQAQRPVVCA